MKKDFFSLIIVVLLSLLFSGCATLFSKTSYPVYIRSNPKGAAISIADKRGKEIYRGTTPATVKLKAKSGYFSRAQYSVTLSAPGYHEKVVPVYFKLNTWYMADLCFNWLGALVVDPLTGAMWVATDPFVDEALEKNTTANIPVLKIIDIKDVPDSLKKDLVKL